ncbi:MAG: glycosyltransferase family 39 protein [Patescibacteria group bacterium]|nr:glycosyltransferase family 39 protein [Patescibacteria group bacterium]
MSLKTKILLIIIILAAIFLRFYNLKYIEFNFDQAANPLLAEQIIKHGPLPQNCLLSSVGVCNPFFFPYLLVPPLLISPDPLFLTGFIALINVFAVLLLFFFVKKFFNETAALISAALLAVNPWAIIFSRTIWQQNVLIFFTILFFGFLFNFAFDNKKTHLIWAFLFLGIVSQLHQLGIILGLILLVCLIIFRKNVIFKNLLIGFLLCLLLYLPFIAFEIKNDWFSFENIIPYSQSPAQLHTTALIYPFQMIGTGGLNYTFGTNYQNFLNTTLNWPIVNAFFIIIFVVGLVFLAWQRQPKYLILLAWFFLLPLALILSKTPIYPHYFIIGIPVGFIIIGILFSKLITNNWKYFFLAFLVFLVLYQAIISFSYLKFPTNRQCVLGNHSQPYIYKLENIKKILATDEKDFAKIHQQSCACPICVPLTTQYILEKVIKK